MVEEAEAAGILIPGKSVIIEPCTSLSSLELVVELTFLDAGSKWEHGHWTRFGIGCERLSMYYYNG